MHAKFKLFFQRCESAFGGGGETAFPRLPGGLPFWWLRRARTGRAGAGSGLSWGCRLVAQVQSGFAALSLRGAWGKA